MNFSKLKGHKNSHCSGFKISIGYFENESGQKYESLGYQRMSLLWSL